MSFTQTVLDAASWLSNYKYHNQCDGYLTSLTELLVITSRFVGMINPIFGVASSVKSIDVSNAYYAPMAAGSNTDMIRAENAVKQFVRETGRAGYVATLPYDGAHHPRWLSGFITGNDVRQQSQAQPTFIRESVQQSPYSWAVAFLRYGFCTADDAQVRCIILNLFEYFLMMCTLARHQLLWRKSCSTRSIVMFLS